MTRGRALGEADREALLARLSTELVPAVRNCSPEVERLVVEREAQNRALFQDASDLIV